MQKTASNDQCALDWKCDECAEIVTKKTTICNQFLAFKNTMTLHELQYFISIPLLGRGSALPPAKNTNENNAKNVHHTKMK